MISKSPVTIIMQRYLQQYLLAIFPFFSFNIVILFKNTVTPPPPALYEKYRGVVTLIWFKNFSIQFFNKLVRNNFIFFDTGQLDMSCVWTWFLSHIVTDDFLIWDK